jgi:FAD/FMN-containing dehydrogenase
MEPELSAVGTRDAASSPRLRSIINDGHRGQPDDPDPTYRQQLFGPTWHRLPPGSLSIDLRNFQDFSLDPSTFVACIGPGLRLGAVDELMYNAGQHFIPHGSSAHVGMGGHGVVGGTGYAPRQYGLSIDYIKEVEVVLPNATITRASQL